MVSSKTKDNIQKNIIPKIEVIDEDKVKVRFNEPWIEMLKVKHSSTKSIWSP